MENIDKKSTLQQGSSALELAETLNKNTELNISQLTFKAILNNSLILEKFSTWLLAGIGATCALIITNINSITKIIDPSIIKYSLLILVISGLLGFLSKYYSIQIQIILELDEILRNLLPKIMEIHIEEEKRVHGTAKEQGVVVNTVPDIIGSMRKALDSVPWFKRKSARKGFEKGVEDPLFGYRRGMRFLYFQSAVTILEFICFLLFIFLVAVSL
jgi:acetylglutamate synthase